MQNNHSEMINSFQKYQKAQTDRNTILFVLIDFFLYFQYFGTALVVYN